MRIIKPTWIDISEKQSVLIEPPTRKQHDVLHDTMVYYSPKRDEDEPKEKRFYRLLVKYCLKDWKGFNTECKTVKTLTGTELDGELLSELVRDDLNFTALALTIFDKIQFDIYDKKKSPFVENLNLKANSTEKEKSTQ